MILALFFLYRHFILSQNICQHIFVDKNIFLHSGICSTLADSSNASVLSNREHLSVSLPPVHLSPFTQKCRDSTCFQRCFLIFQGVCAISSGALWDCISACTGIPDLGNEIRPGRSGGAVQPEPHSSRGNGRTQGRTEARAFYKAFSRLCTLSSH